MASGDRITERYQGKVGDWYQQEKVKSRIHWISSQARGDRVLDIGCSQGILCLLLGREGFRVDGIDIAEEQIAYARNCLSKENQVVQERVSFQIAEARDLPFEDESFDTVIMGEFLEHITNPDSVLEQTRRVLTNGGRAVISVPFGEHRCEDHKRVYYTLSLYELLRHYLWVESMEIQNGFIYCVATRSEAPDEKAPHRMLLEKLEAALPELELTHRRAQERVAKQNKTNVQKVKSLEEELKTRDEEIRSIRSQAWDLEDELVRRRAREKVFEEEISRLKADVEGSDELRSALLAEQRTLQDELEGMRRRLHETEEELDKAKRRSRTGPADLPDLSKYEAIVDRSGITGKNLEVKLNKLVKAYTRLERLYDMVTGGIRFRIGDAFVQAARPSRETLLLPYRLGSLFAEGSMKSLRKRMQNRK